MITSVDCLCGLVVRVYGYRSRDTRFDSLGYQIFWELVGLDRSPLSLMSTTDELLLRNSNGSSLNNREYGCRNLSHWPWYRLQWSKNPVASVCKRTILNKWPRWSLIQYSSLTDWGHGVFWSLQSISCLIHPSIWKYIVWGNKGIIK
jgi:hypothetical protein